MNLNPEQKSAVEHSAGPLLVLAGAGSGKTRVLTNRIIHLIRNCNVSPWQILAVTFTNKAAKEMVSRVETQLGTGINANRNSGFWIGTFHSVCARILRRHGERIGLPRNFVIYDDTDQMKIIRSILKELNISDKIVSPQTALDKISRSKDSLIFPKDFPDGDFYNAKLAAIYRRYQEILEKDGAADFGDLIMRTVELFRKAPDILKHFQNTFVHILIDEYQDTNHAQYELVRLLSEHHKNIFVVGDPDQSIYRWRGADISNILEFERDFPGAKTITLAQNYRSTKNILAASDAVIANNEGRIEKKLWTQNDDGDPITIVESSNEKEEARIVVSEIKNLFDHGKTANDIAIFYRTNAQSRIFEDELRKEGIPYIIYGGVKFYSRAEIKDIIAYLRIIANPLDNASLLRVINVPARGIGDTTIGKLEESAAKLSCSIFELISSNLNAVNVNEGTKKKLRDFAELVTGIAKMKCSPLPDLMNEVIKQTGYVENLKKEKTEESLARIENLEELVSAASETNFEDKETALSEFLDQVALVSDIDKFEEGRPLLPLMTLHLAKGLEFNNVFIVGLEEGLCPHARSLDDPSELEEERRLFYVGMTRTKEKLYLCHAMERMVRGSFTYNVASRFLGEIPEEFTNKISLVAKKSYSFKASNGFKRTENDDFSQISGGEDFGDWEGSDRQKGSGLKAGQRVIHPSFGRGIIRKAEGSPGQKKLIIQFQDGQLKNLSEQYAKLTVIS